MYHHIVHGNTGIEGIAMIIQKRWDGTMIAYDRRDPLIERKCGDARTKIGGNEGKRFAHQLRAGAHLFNLFIRFAIHHVPANIQKNEPGQGRAQIIYSVVCYICTAEEV